MSGEGPFVLSEAWPGRRWVLIGGTDFCTLAEETDPPGLSDGQTADPGYLVRLALTREQVQRLRDWLSVWLAGRGSPHELLPDRG
jgi:hypothetical protein